MPPRPGSLAATIVPSFRRSSTRRISPGRGSVAELRLEATDLTRRRQPFRGEICRWMYALTNERIVAASLPTRPVRVADEKCAPTRTDWAVAAAPTIARKAP